MTIDTISVTTAVNAAVLIDAIMKAGATVVWHGSTASADAVISLEVEVDTEEAYGQIPAEWFEADDMTFADPSAADMGDFIDACRQNDRYLALALLPRIVAEPRCYQLAEQCLLEARS